MTYSTESKHGPDIVVAESGIGRVSVCACGVMTVSVACVSLRFEPAAFQALVALLNEAQSPKRTGVSATAATDLPVRESLQVH